MCHVITGLNQASIQEHTYSPKKAKNQVITGVGKVVPQETAANVINSTMLGPRVVVELEPNVCV